jgi:hypothetical protein
LRGKRSEGRLRTPLPWPRLRLPSSLWKTLRSLALQGRAPINANTGVWANGRGVRGKEKGQEASADLGSPVQPETRTPSEGGRPQAFTAPTALGSEHRRQEFQGWGVSPGEHGCRLSRAPSDHLVMPGCGIHWPAELGASHFGDEHLHLRICNMGIYAQGGLQRKQRRWEGDRPSSLPWMLKRKRNFGTI